VVSLSNHEQPGRPSTGSGRALRTATLALVALALCGPLYLHAAKTDIDIEYDKKYSFAGLRRWAWHPDGAGDTRLAISAQDDAKRIAARVDPVVIPAIEREMKGRGLSQVTDTPDLYVHYYFLGTVGELSQVAGQFLPAVPEWGVPPFTAGSTALTVYPVGTLIIDITSAANRVLVWRGTARRKIDMESPDQKRKQVVEQAIRDLLKGFPPKQ
jgi:Domain of unknown function (DUF4136)